MQLITVINKNFLIRVTENDTKQSYLIGVTTFRALFKTEIKANQVLKKAIQSDKQIFTVKLRRGLTIDFISR